jgi:hypothetical protein
MRIALAALVVDLVGWPLSAWAYRPFDSTDAAVADLHVIEIELSLLSFGHGDKGFALISPSLRLNYGFADNWEVVLEGEADHYSHGHSQLGDAALSLKAVVRDGSLQDKSGISLASEGSVLLPGIGTDDGAGFEWTGIASQRWDWGTIHLNIAGMLTREQKAGVFVGTIFEGPADWAVRPVAELNYEREFGIGEGYSALIGAIWQVSEHLALDFAYRHAEVSNGPDEQIRAGGTFDL